MDGFVDEQGVESRIQSALAMQGEGGLCTNFGWCEEVPTRPR